MALQQIRKVIVHDAVIDNVVTYINENELREGERIPAERALATALGVSRSSVREALKTLESASVLTIRHGGGAYFNSRAALDAFGTFRYDRTQLETLRRIRNLLAARRLIEERVVGWLAPGISDAQLAELETLERDQNAALATPDPEPRFAMPNLTLELAMTAMLGNPVITAMHARLEPLWRQAFQVLAMTPFTPEERHERHTAIIEALRTRSPRAAVKAMAEHNRVVQTFIEDKLRQQGP